MVRSTDSGENSFSAALNSGSSARLSSLITSRARSRDSTSCTWLVTVSGSTVPRSIIVFSASGRRKIFSRPSTRTRASDL